MTATCQALIIVLLTGLDSTDPSMLVNQLGSSKYAERETAARELIEQGKEALPALRAGRQSSDPEVRSRAEILLKKIEQQVLIEPTQVLLDFQDQRLEFVVQAISERSGIALTLVPQGHPNWRSRRLSLQAPEPVSFWKAIDLLCEAGQVRLYQPISLRTGPTTGRTEALRLVDAHSGSTLPHSDAGPLRVFFHEVKLERQVNYLQHSAISPAQFANPNTQPGVKEQVESPPIEEQFYLIMQLVGEPRLMLSQRGPLQMLEVIDDLGQSHLPVDSSEPDMTVRSAGYFGWNAGSSGLQLQTFLKRPKSPGGKLNLIRGKVPLTVSSLRPDPLTIPLEGTEGNTFEAEDMRLTIEAIRINGNINQVDNNNNIEVPQQPGIDLVLQPVGASLEPGPNAVDGGMVVHPGTWTHQMIQNRLEVVDEQGRAYRVLPEQPRIEGGSTRVTLMLLPGGPIGPPVELRYYSLIEAETEITFEFRDILIP